MRRLARNGFEAWAEVIAHDYEGLVAKEQTSPYEAGPTWAMAEAKTKVLDRPRGSRGNDGLASRVAGTPPRWSSDRPRPDALNRETREIHLFETPSLQLPS